jgi:hypothetical protein
VRSVATRVSSFHWRSTLLRVSSGSYLAFVTGEVVIVTAKPVAMAAVNCTWYRPQPSSTHPRSRLRTVLHSSYVAILVAPSTAARVIVVPTPWYKLRTPPGGCAIISRTWYLCAVTQLCWGYTRGGGRQHSRHAEPRASLLLHANFDQVSR